MAHTSGPWEYEPGSEVIRSTQRTIVYELGTNEADGHLIAAAPKLLKELREGVEFVKTAHRRQDCYCDLCCWSGRAEDVISSLEKRGV